MQHELSSMPLFCKCTAGLEHTFIVGLYINVETMSNIQVIAALDGNLEGHQPLGKCL